MDVSKVIYWADIAQQDLQFSKDIDKTKNMCCSLVENGLLQSYDIEDKGVFMYMIADNMKAEKELMEIFFYIKPEHRGNPRLFLDTIKNVEQIANDNNCDYITIASNSGYSNQDKLLRILGKKGYNIDSVRKGLK